MPGTQKIFYKPFGRSDLPIGSLNANCIAKNRIPFGFSNMWGKSEHHTFIKKNPSSSLKTYLLGLETGSRIFGTMISAKKTAKIHR
jgi:hypothetical protein